jgi:hypothetical protein
MSTMSSLASAVNPVAPPSALARWPGVGEYHLDYYQLRCVRALLDRLLNYPCPSLPEAELLWRAGTRKRSLQALFAGTNVMGELVIPGVQPRTYRLSEPTSEPSPFAFSLTNDKVFSDLLVGLFRHVIGARQAARALLRRTELRDNDGAALRDTLEALLFQANTFRGALEATMPDNVVALCNRLNDDE